MHSLTGSDGQVFFGGNNRGKVAVARQPEKTRRFWVRRWSGALWVLSGFLPQAALDSLYGMSVNSLRDSEEEGG